MNTNEKPKTESNSLNDRRSAAERQAGATTLSRSVAIVAALLIGASAGHAAQLQRPGEAIDAGDSYGLRDGSRVALYRLVNEAVIKHIRSKSVETIARQAEIDRQPLITMEQRGSNVVDVYSL